MALVDAFLKLKGIEGESTRKGFEKMIEIQAFTWGAHNASSIGSGGGGGVSRGQIQSLTLSTIVKKESPKLFEYCASGQHVDEATLFVNKATGDDKPITYLKITMKEAYITSYIISGAGADELPSVEIALDANYLEFEYTPQSAKGTPESPVVTTWDQAKGSRG